MNCSPKRLFEKVERRLQSTGFEPVSWARELLSLKNVICGLTSTGLSVTVRPASWNHFGRRPPNTRTSPSSFKLTKKGDSDAFTAKSLTKRGGRGAAGVSPHLSLRPSTPRRRLTVRVVRVPVLRTPALGKRTGSLSKSEALGAIPTVAPASFFASRQSRHRCLDKRTEQNVRIVSKNHHERRPQLTLWPPAPDTLPLLFLTTAPRPRRRRCSAIPSLQKGKHRKQTVSQ